MKKIYVRFRSMIEAKHIVEIASACDYDVDLVCGRYVIDAKSMLGVFSLPQFDKVKMVMHSDDIEDVVDKLKAMNLLAE